MESQPQWVGIIAIHKKNKENKLKIMKVKIKNKKISIGTWTVAQKLLPKRPNKKPFQKRVFNVQKNKKNVYNAIML